MGCFFKINLFTYLFIYTFGCVGSLLLHVGFLQLRRAGAALCCGAWASHCGGFSCCRARALGAWASVVGACRLQSAGSVVVAHCLSSCGSQALEHRLSSCGTRAQQLWHTGLVAPWHVGSSWTRARTRVPCTGRRILNHCATREAQSVGFQEGLQIYLHLTD